MELLGRFELPTSSLPTAAEPSSSCCTRLFGSFLFKKDEVAVCLLHCFHPLISPCGSRCGSKLLQLIKKRRQNIKYDRADNCPVRVLIMMHQPVPQSCNLHPRDIRIHRPVHERGQAEMMRWRKTKKRADNPCCLMAHGLSALRLCVRLRTYSVVQPLI